MFCFCFHVDLTGYIIFCLLSACMDRQTQVRQCRTPQPCTLLVAISQSRKDLQNCTLKMLKLECFDVDLVFCFFLLLSLVSDINIYSLFFPFRFYLYVVLGFCVLHIYTKLCLYIQSSVPLSFVVYWCH